MASEDLRIEKIDVPALAAAEVLVRVRLELPTVPTQKSGSAAIKRNDSTAGRLWPRTGRRRRGRGKRVDPRWRIGMPRYRREFRAVSATAITAAVPGKSCDGLLLTTALRRLHGHPGRIVWKILLERPQRWKIRATRGRAPGELRAFANSREESAGRRYHL